ncbi:MAG: hypothetical protein GY841_04815 [FCB group bacterium]|nr:hypothetical protein [FCB group bacterium]
MIKRLTVAVLLLALINLNIGCTGEIRRISARELRGQLDGNSETSRISENEKNNVVSVTLSTLIAGVVLETGEIIIFDSTGAIFDIESNTLASVDINGKQRLIDVDEIQQIIYDEKNQKILFDEDRGKLDLEKQHIYGYTTENQMTEIPVNDVLYLEVGKIDIPITILLVGSILVFCIALYIVIDSYDPVLVSDWKWR